MKRLHFIQFKHLYTIAFLAIMASLISILCISIFSSTAYADPGDVKELYGKKIHKVIFTGKASWFYGDDLSKNKITNLKSSNNKVVSLKSAYAGKCFDMFFKKAGTAKISFTYKGKKRTTTIKLIKYVNPFKSLKIGGKEMKAIANTKSVHTDFYGKVVTKKFNYVVDGKTVNVKAKTGWKILKIKSLSLNTNTWKETTKTLKNGAVAQGFAIEVSMKNKKNGLTETIRINEY